jgi:hypothetical protein
MTQDDVLTIYILQWGLEMMGEVASKNNLNYDVD